MNQATRKQIIDMSAAGASRETIAAAVGVKLRVVSQARREHVMGVKTDRRLKYNLREQVRARDEKITRMRDDLMAMRQVLHAQGLNQPIAAGRMESLVGYINAIVQASRNFDINAVVRTAELATDLARNILEMDIPPERYSNLKGVRI